MVCIASKKLVDKNAWNHVIQMLSLWKFGRFLLLGKKLTRIAQSIQNLVLRNDQEKSRVPDAALPKYYPELDLEQINI